jgi:hypothetical protein
LPSKNEKGSEMKIKLVTMTALALAAMLFACGCSIGGGSSATYDVYDRLDKLDDYKDLLREQNPAQELERAQTQSSGAFRNIAFGSTRDVVLLNEPINVLEEYDNAVDFESISVFGYDMLPTFWFNDAGQLFRGSYFALSGEDMHSIIASMLTQLNDLYGTAVETNYYDDENNLVYFDSEQQASAAVSSGEAYFYAWYSLNDIDVEVYIEVRKPNGNTTKYDVFVYFTDYTFYDFE